MDDALRQLGIDAVATICALGALGLFALALWTELEPWRRKRRDARVHRERMHKRTSSKETQ